jgi:hypothetical protein
VIFFALLGLGVIAAVLVAAAMSLFLPRYGETDPPPESDEGTPPP